MTARNIVSTDGQNIPVADATRLGDVVYDRTANRFKYCDGTAWLFCSAPADARVDQLTAPIDSTDLNVSTAAHGLCPKLPGNTTTFLRGDGTFAAPPSGGGGGGEAFPVGAVFIAVVSTNPSTLLGYGTWAALGAGRTLVGVDASDPDFDTAKETGGAKTRGISAHAGAAVGDHGSHTHAYTDVVNHTHAVSVSDPGHSHLTQRYPTATGTSTGFTIDTSMSGTLADNTLPTKAATTGITASTANPAGGVASGTTAGPSATLTHAVTQPGNHSDLNIVQPYIVVYFWERTA